MGSVTSQQIWDQFWRSQRAVFILVQSGQMVGSSALDTMVAGGVTSQQIWDHLWRSQRAVIMLVQCGQMVSSSVLETLVVDSVTSRQIWDRFWRSQWALVIVVQSEQMVGSSALDTMILGSVTSRQIWHQSASLLGNKFIVEKDRVLTVKHSATQTANTAYYCPQLCNHFDLAYFQHFLLYKYFGCNFPPFLFHSVFAS